MIGILLSALFPGLGQFYFRKGTRGLVMVALAVTPLYPLVLIWSVWDAYQLARTNTVTEARRRQAVFALVLAFIVVPIALALFGFSARLVMRWYTERQKPSQTESEMKLVQIALEKYESQTGRYPESLDVLVRGRPPRQRWLTDAWGRPYVYESSDIAYRFLSLGADGVAGTTDDIAPRTTKSDGF